MDIVNVLKMILEATQNTRSRYHLTIHTLLLDPEWLDSEGFVTFSGGGSPCNPHSYRGHAKDLAFETQPEPVLIRDFIKQCEDLVGHCFEGYRGGSFMMTTETPLWRAERGQTGLAIVDMDWDFEISDDLVLITKSVG
jgi:hypothetical protein